MELADLIDLEWRLQADARAEDPAAVRARDRAWGPGIVEELGADADTLRHTLARDRAARAQVCAAWLGRLRQQADHGLPGQRMAAGLAWTTWGLAAFGALLGWGAASAALAYDGSEPVNVLVFVGVFFVLQILLLAALVAALLVRRGGGALSLPARIVGSIAQSRVVDRLLGAQVQRAAATAGDFRVVGSLYGDVGKWALFRATQWFGVAFNVAALLTCLMTVAVTDLVFSWSTTLDVTPAQVHAWVRGLGFWWWWAPDAIPSEAAVEASQWVRMQGAFVAGSAPQSTAVWWKYLVAGLLAYGLVPRALALFVGHRALRRAQRRASLDHAGFQRLYERIVHQARAAAWAGPAPDEVRGAAPQPNAEGGAARAGVGDRLGHERWVLCWGRLGAAAARVEAWWGEQGVTALGCVAVGGADLADDERALAQLAAAAAAIGGGPALWVTVVFDADHQPTKEVLGFFARLRAVAGPTACLTAQLVFDGDDGGFAAAEPDQLRAWDRSLRAVGDPYLWLENPGDDEVGA